MTAAPDYEGLQVHYQPHNAGPEPIAYNNSYPQPVFHSDKEVNHSDNAVAPAGTAESKTNKRICGLSRAVFVSLVVALVVIIAAAVGGGVGGALGSKKSSSPPPREVCSACYLKESWVAPR